MPRPERFSNIQALAWLNAIAENDSGDESEGEHICEGLDQGSENSDQVRPTWKVISLALFGPRDLRRASPTWGSFCPESLKRYIF